MYNQKELEDIYDEFLSLEGNLFVEVDEDFDKVDNNSSVKKFSRLNNNNNFLSCDGIENMDDPDITIQLDLLNQNFASLSSDQCTNVKIPTSTNDFDIQELIGDKSIRPTSLFSKKDTEIDTEVKEIDERRTSQDIILSKNNAYYANDWGPESLGLWHSGPSSLYSSQPSNINKSDQNLVFVSSYTANNGADSQTPNVFCSTSRAYSHQQLGVKVEMVYNLLSMLDTNNREDMSKTFLAMSSSPESCHAMRQSGCLPLLVQLIHSPELDVEVRNRAAEALYNMVDAQTDEKRRRREMRVLKLLQQVREYCNDIKIVFGKGETLFNGDSDRHPIAAVGALMKFSFDAEHRQAICSLGGLHAITELMQIDHEVHGNSSDNTSCVTLRRYAGMSLTNLTFGDGKNKALLCSFHKFMRALVEQLNNPSEDLRQVTASVLRNLSWRADADSKQTLREVGAVPALTSAGMEVKKESTLKSILSALWNLSAHCSMNKVDICSVPGALAFLVKMLKYKSMSNTLAIVENAGGIIRNISSHIAVREDYRQILRDNNCFEILLEHLKSPSLTIVSNACGTLWNLSARCSEDQKRLWEMGATTMLRSLIQSKHKMISMGSSAALKNLLTANPSGNLMNHLDSTAKSLGLQNLPSLFVRKQRALEQELNITLAETCDNIEPGGSPTFSKKLLSTTEDKTSNAPKRSDSHESIRSTQSDSVYERINQMVLENDNKLFENKNTTLHESLNEKQNSRKAENQKLMKRYRASMIPMPTLKKMNQDKLNERTRVNTLPEENANPLLNEADLQIKTEERLESKKGISLLQTGQKSTLSAAHLPSSSLQRKEDQDLNTNHLYSNSVNGIVNNNMEHNETESQQPTRFTYSATEKLKNRNVVKDFIKKGRETDRKPSESDSQISLEKVGTTTNFTDHIFEKLSEKFDADDHEPNSNHNNSLTCLNVCNQQTSKIAEQTSKASTSSISWIESQSAESCQSNFTSSVKYFNESSDGLECTKPPLSKNIEISDTNSLTSITEKSSVLEKSWDGSARKFCCVDRVSSKIQESSENSAVSPKFEPRESEIKRIGKNENICVNDQLDFSVTADKRKVLTDEFENYRDLAEVSFPNFKIGCEITDSKFLQQEANKICFEIQRHQEVDMGCSLTSDVSLISCSSFLDTGDYSLLDASTDITDLEETEDLHFKKSFNKSKNVPQRKAFISLSAEPVSLPSLESLRNEQIEALDLDSSIISVASITSELAETFSKDKDCCNTYTKTFKNDDLEDTVGDNTFYSIEEETLSVGSNRNCLEPDDDNSLHSQENLPLDMEVSKELPSIQLCRKLTPKEKRQTFQDRYKTYTIRDLQGKITSEAAEYIKEKQSHLENICGIEDVDFFKDKEMQSHFARKMNNGDIGQIFLTNKEELKEKKIEKKDILSVTLGSECKHELLKVSKSFDKDFNRIQNINSDSRSLSDLLIVGPAERKELVDNAKLVAFSLKTAVQESDPEILSDSEVEDNHQSVAINTATYNKMDRELLKIRRESIKCSDHNDVMQSERFAIYKEQEKEYPVACDLQKVQHFELYTNQEKVSSETYGTHDSEFVDVTIRDGEVETFDSPVNSDVEEIQEKKGPKILKPKGKFEEEKSEETSKAIRGRRKPLYSRSLAKFTKGNTSIPGSPKIFKTSAEPTNFSLTTAKSLPNVSKSGEPPILRREETFTKEPNVVSGNSTKSGRGIPVLARNVDSKISALAEASVKYKSGVSAKSTKRTTEALKFTRPVSVFASKNSDKQIEVVQKRLIFNESGTKAIGNSLKNNKRFSSPNSTSHEIRNSPSNQSLKSNSSTKNVNGVKQKSSSFQSSKSLSNANLSLVSSVDKGKHGTAKKEITSKIAGLWKKVEETKRKTKNSKDDRVWIGTEKKCDENSPCVEQEEILDIPTRKLL